MRIGGRWDARPAAAAGRRPAVGVMGKRVFAVALLIPLVFASAVGGAAPVFPGKSTTVRAAVTPVAAVSPAGLSGPVVIAMARPPTDFHVAAAALSAPPPAMIVNAPGALGVPVIALSAYRSAEQKMAIADPGCGVS